MFTTPKNHQSTKFRYRSRHLRYHDDPGPTQSDRQRLVIYIAPNLSKNQWTRVQISMWRPIFFRKTYKFRQGAPLSVSIFFDFFTTGGRPAKSSVSPRREATSWSKVAFRLGETLVLHKNVPRRFQKRAKTMEGMLNIAISEFCAQSKQSALSALSWLWHAARNHHSTRAGGQDDGS